jgi:signal transduction histidine kinase
LTSKRSRKTEGVSPSAPAARGLRTEPSTYSEIEVANLRKQNAALEQENDELQRLLGYRSQVLARLAHELRNPLTSIMGFTEILLNHEKLTVAQEDFCRKIQNSAVKIEADVSQLADLARLEAGHHTISLEEFSLIDALRETCLALSGHARKHSASLDCPAEGGRFAIVSDRGKVRQVLYNFLAYAIGRSPDGAVVKTTLEKVGRDLTIKIEDEGERLSKPFLVLLSADPLRIDPTIGADEPGLVIARQLIDVLRGKLTLQNRAPHGLVTTIQFPSQPPDLGNR